MADETSTTEPRHFERLKPYDCATEGHIYGKWFPSSTSTMRRACEIPGCHHIDTKKVFG